MVVQSAPPLLVAPVWPLQTQPELLPTPAVVVGAPVLVTPLFGSAVELDSKAKLFWGPENEGVVCPDATVVVPNAQLGQPFEDKYERHVSI